MKYEAIGLCGTVFILIAFLLNGEKKIRIFDMIGSVLFVVYGALIGAYSNMILNSALIIVHLVKLHKMKKNEERRDEGV